MTGPETVDVDHVDVIAIGCGPFNLGLAALASTVDDLDLAVLEARPDFSWHPGLMFDDAMLQVSFLADLVSLVDPTHPLSFLAYLGDNDRLYPFYVREQFHPTRREYEDYLRWAAARLPAVRFSHRVEAVRWDGAAQHFVADVVRGDGDRIQLASRHLVLGIGTEPFVPPALAGLPPGRLVHTGEYLHRQDDVDGARAVTVVGSGQSGAEVVLDLLRRDGESSPAVNWLTRTVSFAPLDYTKLVLEMTTPAYVDYFHALPDEVRDRLVRDQWRHYKGISEETIEAIHEALYAREFRPGSPPVQLRQGVAVREARVDDSGAVALTCEHADTGAVFEHRTDLVVAATGYRERPPAFLEPIESFVRRDARGRFVVGRDHGIELDASVTGRVFVANADLHSHGVAAPDLGIGAYRNATILNAIAGREVYRLPKRTAFTTFDAPPAPLG